MLDVHSWSRMLAIIFAWINFFNWMLLPCYSVIFLLWPAFIGIQWGHRTDNYALSVGVISMHGQYAWSICMINMHDQYAWSICMINMHDQCAWSICMINMHDQCAWSMCMINIWFDLIPWTSNICKQKLKCSYGKKKTKRFHIPLRGPPT